MNHPDRPDFFVLWSPFLQGGIFLTRLPLGRLAGDAPPPPPAMLVWTFPLWGAVMGSGISLGGGVLLWLGLPPELTALAMVALGIILSGALHEDGFADCCDGFWGGDTPERRLKIMRDARLGSYGVLGLVLTTGWRWLALASIPEEAMLVGFVLMQVLPRGGLGLLWNFFPAVTTSSMARIRPNLLPATISLGLGAVIVFGLGLWLDPALIVPLMIVTLAGMFGFGWLARRKLGGLNGDCLGGAEQVGQMAVAAVMAMLP